MDVLALNIQALLLPIFAKLHKSWGVSFRYLSSVAAIFVKLHTINMQKCMLFALMTNSGQARGETSIAKQIKRSYYKSMAEQ